MLMRTVLILMSLLMLQFSPAAAADDELFDTGAAAASRQEGLAALKHKNYDAAIDAFEDAVASAPDAESYYLLGYAYYMKGKTGDEESRLKAVENFNQAYQINPNFTPSKIKPEDITMEGAAPDGEKSLGAAAPENKKEPRAEQPKPATPPAQPQVTSEPTKTTEQPKQ